ncbi:hypothetical protein EW145_g6399 [Phellinidium pouzarii]|uniref:DNA damage-binding protein 1 n=1 Tax=Phellinidium pouzarii TaxID=167371 RepID=A0A4S4KXW0_9AGAM|nr:hypothetical protein EW145_g6399 [Phellinidium pouzarii]
MKAVATFHRPTSVVDSLRTTLTDDGDVEYLVVAKTCILEVFVILTDALRLQCSLEIWGRITSLQAIPLEGTSEHHLLVLTDHQDPRLLLFKYFQKSGDKNSEIKCIKDLPLYERNARPTEFFNGCLVDRKGKVAVVSSYVGKLKILELDNGLIHSDFDVSVRELNILSLCFLPTATSRSVALAILHRDHTQMLVLTSHDLSVSDHELSSSSTLLPDVNLSDIDSGFLIPVPPHTRSTWNPNGGILVLGGKCIKYLIIDKKQRKKNNTSGPVGAKAVKAEIDWQFSKITAWSQVDTEGKRYLLGDAFGRLFVLLFDLEFPKMVIMSLGEVSPPTSITLLPSQYLFVGSHFGDSQLVHVVSNKSLASGTFIEVAEVYKNIAPIIDAVLADIDNTGQPAIVTCSGGRSAGSLRIIRNGANFNEDVRIDGIPNATGMWPLKMQYDDEYHCFILVTTRVSSHLLKLPQSRHEDALSRPTTFVEIRLDVPTLASGNVLTQFTSPTGKSTFKGGPYMVQVIPSAVMLLNTSLGIREDMWEPDRGCEIVVADVSPSQICLAMSGGRVVLLNILGEKILEQSRKMFAETTGKAAEISALTISPISPGLAFASFVVLSFWSSHEIKVFTLPAFTRTDEPVILPHLPRSLLLYDFGDKETGSHIHLMVGLANGVVVSFPFTKGKLGERKVVALGESPVFLSACTDVMTASPLHSAVFPSSIILSSPDGLVIGRVLELDKLHIRTINLGVDNPVKLAYHSNANLIGVGCLRQEHIEANNFGDAISTFKLLDAADFTTTHDFSLETEEEITAVAAVTLETQYGNEMVFAVGSVYFDDTEGEPSRGRIFIFSAGISTTSSDRKGPPQLLADTQAHGCVYALACIQGKLVAAVNTGVVIFSLEYHDNHAIRLARLAEWNHNYLVTSVVTSNDQIIIGDAVASLAVLRLVGDKLVTITRDYGPLWPLCIEVIGEQTIIGSNSNNNLFSFKLQHQGDEKSLERDGFYNIDETVNRFVPGCFDKSGNKLGISPALLLFTTAGRIAMVINLDDALSRQLSCLERNLAGAIQGPGNMDHTSWRAPKNSQGRSDAQAAAVGFLDGDLLERFLDYPAASPEIARIMSGKNEAERLTTPYGQMRSILESLRSTH